MSNQTWAAAYGLSESPPFEPDEDMSEDMSEENAGMPEKKKTAVKPNTEKKQTHVKPPKMTHKIWNALNDDQKKLESDKASIIKKPSDLKMNKSKWDAKTNSEKRNAIKKWDREKAKARRDKMA